MFRTLAELAFDIRIKIEADWLCYNPTSLNNFFD